MTLDNLLGNTLERIEPDPAAIRRLLQAAERNLADAGIEAVSPENRFDAAYKAIMQLANLALQANGYRTLTSRPGHHMTMIQSLTRSIGLDRERMISLDTLRKQRNVSDYSGDPVSPAAMETCIASAEALLEDVKAWLQSHYPNGL
ncbi:MAG: HEPN domain-containing protein [Wenzhouxiangella sp.]|nr:HEPN domain-containing protein [Wenzhouxiangella sp.]